MIKKLLLISLIAFAGTILANEVKVVNVTAKCTINKVCSFNVTLKHAQDGNILQINGRSILLIIN